MNDIIIENVSKMFKLYKKPFYKIVDVFGFSWLLKDYYNEFWALRDINLTFAEGEKVAFIGRNGAGKSTLLKLIAGNSNPTAGRIRIDGRVTALFTLGTGFHPDFSGRENIFASLAYQGVVGRKARNMFDEIVDFAELEEFIENPVKTYSAGMYARLAFSVATSIKPEILIIDEVLGAGDAYFNSKAMERMQQLTSGGSTVFFVTHDLLSAQRLCNRGIWIDRGKVLMDGDILEVVKAYSAETRKLEERRLKAKNMALSRKFMSTVDMATDDAQLLFRFIPETGDSGVTVSFRDISLYENGEIFANIRLGDTMDNDVSQESFLLVDEKKNSWSKPIKTENGWGRNFLFADSAYKSAPFVFRIPSYCLKSRLCLKLLYRDTASSRAFLEIYDGEKNYIKIGNLDFCDDREWKEKDFEIPGDALFPQISQGEEITVSSEEVSEMSDSIKESSDEELTSDASSISGNEIDCEAQTEVQEMSEPDEVFPPELVPPVAIDIDGSGEIDILRAFFCDEKDDARFTFLEGEVIRLIVDYRVNTSLPEFPWFACTIMTGQGLYVDNFWKKLSTDKPGIYTLTLTFDSIFLKREDYLCSIEFLKFVDEGDTTKMWPYYVLWDRRLEFKIQKEGLEAINRGIVQLNPVWNVTDGGEKAEKQEYKVLD